MAATGSSVAERPTEIDAAGALLDAPVLGVLKADLGVFCLVHPGIHKYRHILYGDTSA